MPGYDRPYVWIIRTPKRDIVFSRGETAMRVAATLTARGIAHEMDIASQGDDEEARNALLATLSE